MKEQLPGIGAMLRAEAYKTVFRDGDPTTRPRTFGEILNIPTRHVLISHRVGQDTKPVVSTRGEDELRTETGLSGELTNVLHAICKLTGQRPQELTPQIIKRSGRYKEGFARWLDMREKEPLMLNGLHVDGDPFRSGLVGYTMPYPELDTPEKRVDFLVDTISPNYHNLAETLKSEIGFNVRDLTRVLLLPDADKLFRGLDIVDKEIYAILTKLRGDNYMNDRGRVLYKILDIHGNERSIRYQYDQSTGTLSQEYSVEVPNASVIGIPNNYYKHTGWEKQDETTFVRRMGIFCHPFFRAALEIWREMETK